MKINYKKTLILIQIILIFLCLDLSSPLNIKSFIRKKNLDMELRKLNETNEPTVTEKKREEPTETEKTHEEPIEIENSTKEPTETEKPTEEPKETEKPTEEPTETEKPTEELTETEKPKEESTETEKPTEQSTETMKPTEESIEITSIGEPATRLLTQSSTKIITTVSTTTLTNPTTTPVSGPITTITVTTTPVSNASNATALNNSTYFYRSKSSSGLSTGEICAIAMPLTSAVIGIVAACLLKGGAAPIPQKMAPSLPPSNFIETSVAKMNIPEFPPQQPLPVEIIQSEQPVSVGIIQPQSKAVQMIQPQPVQQIIRPSYPIPKAEPPVINRTFQPMYFKHPITAQQAKMVPVQQVEMVPTRKVEMIPVHEVVPI